MCKECTVGHIIRDPYEVYIGRGSKWGNPYCVKEFGRDVAISNYKYDLHKKIENGELIRSDFEELQGKMLGCFCKPYHDCHGDVIAEVVSNLDVYFPPAEGKGMHRLAVVGSIDFGNYQQFCSVMDAFLNTFPSVDTLVSGGARGAGKFAEKYAKKHDLKMDIYLAQWDYFGKSAGFKRNHTIWENSDFGIVFWDGQSKGSAHSFELAKKQGKPIYIFNYKLNCYVNMDGSPII